MGISPEIKSTFREVRTTGLGFKVFHIVAQLRRGIPLYAMRYAAKAYQGR